MIAHEGFDCRNSNPSGLLGQGTYFAGEGERCLLHAGWAHSAHCTACSKLAGQPPICNHTAHTSPLPSVTAASSSYSSAYSRAPVRVLSATNPLPASVPRLAVPPGCHAMFLCRVALGRQALPARVVCTYACVQPAPVRAACAVALAVALPLAAAEPRCAAHAHACRSTPGSAGLRKAPAGFQSTSGAPAIWAVYHNDQVRLSIHLRCRCV